MIIDYLFPILTTYVLNQSHGHWLLNGTLNSIIFMVLKLRNAHEVLPSLQNLMEEESIIVDELTSFASNIRKEVSIVLEFFLSFLRNFEEKKAHNMFCLMLTPRFKSFHLVFSFIGREQGVVIVE